MLVPALLRALKGPFNFLRKDLAEILRIFPDAERALPMPQRVWLEDESATPLLAFPVQMTPDLHQLERALEQYLLVEEEVQLAVLARQPFDPALYAAAWERYRGLLGRATENATASSYGRHYPAIFWLHHSWAVARILRDTPKRMMRRSLALGRERGDELRYVVLFRYLDRVADLTYDIVHRLAADTEEVEEELFPTLFTRMRDNVLIFTEDYVSANLAELTGYFAGYLKLDGRELRSRLAAFTDWMGPQLRADHELRHAVRLAGGDADGEPRELLVRQGFATYLAQRPGYDPRAFFDGEGLQVWERLLVKLKEFELLNALRRLIIGVEQEGGSLVSHDRSLQRFGVAPQALRLSSATRPLDFMASWVVDPIVARCGLIYDISDFTETISALRRAALQDQERSFRQLFLFQRRLNRMALHYRAKMEKYLGDGAFFSSREARSLLAFAIQVQRLYRQALAESFPFRHGLRLALNFGQYRLLPIQVGQSSESERYEFFGHGVVELTRLTTGKSTKEIDEIRTLLVTRGYPESAVNRFFGPLIAQNVDVVEKSEEAREFFAYINPNGSLINEGIAATDAFVALLDQECGRSRLFRVQDGSRTYVTVRLESSPAAPSQLIGLRKLGLANLKGLDRMPIHEVVDGGAWTDFTLVELRGTSLVEAIEREFAHRVTGSGAALPS